MLDLLVDQLNVFLVDAKCPVNIHGATENT